MQKIIQTIKVVVASLMLAVGFSYAFALPAAAATGAAADAKQDVCAGITSTGGSCNDSGADLQKVIRLIVQIISAIAGIAAVIMIIIAGLRYITSGGDASKVAGAKSAIIYAIVGLVVVALAQVIVRFVADKTVE